MPVPIVLGGVIATLYFGRDIFIPLALAITLAMILSPAVGWLEKLHIPRFPAVLGVMFVAISAASGISYIIFNELIHVANELPNYRVNIDRRLASLRKPTNSALGRAEQSVIELGDKLSSAGNPSPTPPVKKPAGASGTNANPLAVQVVGPPVNNLIFLYDRIKPMLLPLAIVGIVLVFAVFLMTEYADLRNRLFRLAGLSRLNVMTQALDDATRRVSRYLMLQFLVNAGFGIVCAVGLYFVGLPYAALWGTVAALLRIVPFVGSVAAGLLPVVLSLAVFDGWLQPSLIFLFFAALEVVTGNFFEPWLYGVNTGVSPVALLLTTVFWSVLWGPAGLILATPLTVCVVVMGRYIPQLSFLHVLLGDQPVLERDALLYQRLLAMDDQDARSLAEEYRRQNSSLQLFDNVMLPALAMAELDRHKGAIDSEHEEFLFLCMWEFLTEFADSPQPPPEQERDFAAPAYGAGRILCFPAHDEADEIAAAMLSQLLEQSGRAVITFPLGASPQGLLDLINPTADDVFCISSVPPFAFAHARAISRDLRKHSPDVPILIGVWGFSGELESALKRFQKSAPDKLVYTLAGALEFLGVHPPGTKNQSA